MGRHTAAADAPTWLLLLLVLRQATIADSSITHAVLLNNSSSGSSNISLCLCFQGIAVGSCCCCCWMVAVCVMRQRNLPVCLLPTSNRFVTSHCCLLGLL